MAFIQSVNFCQVITMTNSSNFKEGKIMNNSKNSLLKIMHICKILTQKFVIIYNSHIVNCT